MTWLLEDGSGSAAGCYRNLSICQVEVGPTLLLDRSARGRRDVEAVIRDNLDLVCSARAGHPSVLGSTLVCSAQPD